MKYSEIKMLSKYKIIVLGIFIIIFYWITESLIHFLIISPTKSFFATFFTPGTHELWMRISAISFIVLFTFISNYLYILDKRKEEQLTHLGSVLKAIRNVNQIIVREKRRKPLIKKVCKRLIETRGFLSAWIAVFDKEGNISLTSEAGIGNDFELLKKELARKNSTICYSKAIKQPGSLIIKDPKTFCEQCPISQIYGKRSVICNPLVYEDKRYGILTVSLPKEMANFEEERALFEEVSDDIAFALYNIELEEGKRKTEERLRKALNRSHFYRDLLAHDMGNILNNLKSSSQLMEILGDQPNKKEDIIELKKISKDQIERGTKLIKNIQKLSKIEEGREELKVLKLNKVLEEAMKLVKSQVKQVDVYLDIPQNDYYIWGGDLLLDAFENIILNGIIHNESEKVKLWIKISEIMWEGSDYVKMEFKDNGIGIADESKQVVFTKSYKRKQATVGMGMGLSLVNEIIREYGGKIWVEDRVKGDYSKGTNFILLLKKSKIIF